MGSSYNYTAKYRLPSPQRTSDVKLAATDLPALTTAVETALDTAVETAVADPSLVKTDDDRLPRDSHSLEGYVEVWADQANAVAMGIRSTGRVHIPALDATELNGTTHRTSFTDQDLVSVIVDEAGTIAHPSAIRSDGRFPDFVVADFADRMNRAGLITGTGGGAGGATQQVYPDRSWWLVGDSMTDGYGSERGSGYAPDIAAATGWAAQNSGWSGQTSVHIASRAAGLPAQLTFAGGQIPATGAVSVTGVVNDPLGGDLPPSGVRERAGRVMLADGTFVYGTLAKSATGSTFTFTRATDGQAATPPAPALFITDESLTGRTKHVVIEVGRNNVLTSSPETICSHIRAIRDALPVQVKRVMVVQIAPLATETLGTANRAIVDAANEAIKATFRAEWVPLYDWLRTDQAFTYAGVTKTAQDDTDIANGITPSSLRQDVVHLKRAGNKAKGMRLADIARERGWL